MTGAGKTEAALVRGLPDDRVEAVAATGCSSACPPWQRPGAMFGRHDPARRGAPVRGNWTVADPRAWAGRSARRVSLLTGGLSEDDTGPRRLTARAGLNDVPAPFTARRRGRTGTIDQCADGHPSHPYSPPCGVFGLTDRVLIVDEAHAYDPYMQRQLETLLKMQCHERRLCHRDDGDTAAEDAAAIRRRVRRRDCAEQPAVKLGCQAYPALAIVGSGHFAASESSLLRPRTARFGVARIDDVWSLRQIVCCGMRPAGAACVCGAQTPSMTPSPPSRCSVGGIARRACCTPALRLATGCATKPTAIDQVRRATLVDRARTRARGHAGRRGVVGPGLRRHGVRLGANRRLDPARRPAVATPGFRRPAAERPVFSVIAKLTVLVSRPGPGGGRPLAEQGAVGRGARSLPKHDHQWSTARSDIRRRRNKRTGRGAMP